MQIRIALPTYGQIAAELQRSSPGLQTRHNLAHYLIKREMAKSTPCSVVSMLNNSVVVTCNGSEPDSVRSSIHKLIKQTYAEVFEVNLDSFLSKNFLDA